MLFLIDENLPVAVGKLFADRGFTVECVSESEELRGKPDENIFEYAVGKHGVIVTRDLRIANPLRFPLHKARGIIVLRFPNEVSIQGLINETRRLTSDLREEDFQQLLVIEPGVIRARPLS